MVAVADLQPLVCTNCSGGVSECILRMEKRRWNYDDDISVHCSGDDIDHDILWLLYTIYCCCKFGKLCVYTYVWGGEEIRSVGGNACILMYGCKLKKKVLKSPNWNNLFSGHQPINWTICHQSSISGGCTLPLWPNLPGLWHQLLLWPGLLDACSYYTVNKIFNKVSLGVPCKVNEYFLVITTPYLVFDILWCC